MPPHMREVSVEGGDNVGVYVTAVVNDNVGRSKFACRRIEVLLVALVARYELIPLPATLGFT